IGPPAVWNLAPQSPQPVRPQTSTAKPPAQPQPGSAAPAPSTRPSTTTTGGQPPTPRPPAAVSEKDLTVALNVVDRSGRPIADASACLARTAVTIPASTS